MQIELRELSDIRPYENNPRHNNDAVDAVAASIREFGFRQPIVVDPEGVIVVGHTRYKAALKLGLDKVPVHVATDLTPEQIKAYRIADNKTNELSDWNYDLLPIELSALQACNYDLGLLGFDPDELARLLDPGVKDGLTDPDEVPEPPDEATTRPGDLWLLGNHRLLCGDAGKPEDVDRLLEGAAIHLVNTDPPYNVKVEPRSNNAIAAGLSSFPATKQGAIDAADAGGMHHQGFDLACDKTKSKPTTKKLRPKDRPLANDSVSDEAFDALLDAWFGNMARVLVPGRGFYIWGGYAHCGNYPPFLKKHGLYFSQAIIWVKEHPVLNRKDFMGNHEWCFYGWREGAAHIYLGPNNATDVWRLSRVRAGNAVALGSGVRLQAQGATIDVCPTSSLRDGIRVVECGEEVYVSDSSRVATDVWSVKKVNPQSMVHLTQKPVELAVRAMQYSSRPGENVLDLFGGSGSTLIAAEQTRRKAFLMELDPLYCDVIVQRWEKFTGRKADRVPANEETQT